MKTIKIHYYAVNSAPVGTDIEKILEELKKEELTNRLKVCGYQEIRLDHIEKRHDEKVNEDYWILRFSKFRHDNWPGVANIREISKDLELEDDSVLAEETTMAYWPIKKKALIQYNHFGVRASKIQEYLSLSVMRDGGIISLTPILTAEAMDKYLNKQIVTSMEASIDGVSDADLEFFDGSGLKESLQHSIENKATIARFAFSVDARIKTEKLDRSWVERIVDGVLRRGGDRDKLSVSVKGDEDEALEVLNLLEERKVTEFDESQIERTEGRRYKPEQLEAILTQAYREWHSQEFR